MLGKFAKFLLVAGIFLLTLSSALFTLELFSAHISVHSLLGLGLTTVLFGIGIILIKDVDIEI